MKSPVFDFESTTTAILFNESPLIHLGPEITTAYTTARDARQVFVLMTPSASNLTPPLHQLLSRDECMWMVGAEDGTTYNAFTGQPYHWTGVVFEALDGVAEDFKRPGDENDGGIIEIRAELYHPARENTVIGELAESVFTLVTGSIPLGWGLHEPVSEPWHKRSLTDHAFHRAPMTSQYTVVGRPRPGTTASTLAVLTVERSSRGVHESIVFWAASPEPADAELIEEFGFGMHRLAVRSAVLAHAVLLPQLAVPSRFHGLTVPCVAVFGPEALSFRGPERALADTAGAGHFVGVPPLQSLVVDYVQQPTVGRDHPLEEHEALVIRLAPPRF